MASATGRATHQSQGHRVFIQDAPVMCVPPPCLTCPSPSRSPGSILITSKGRAATQPFLRWTAPAASCHHLPDSPSSGAGQVRLDVAARPSLSPPPGEALL